MHEGIRRGTDFLSTYEERRKRGWDIDNGLGGYASSTAIEAGTRPCHGCCNSFGEFSRKAFAVSTGDISFLTLEKVDKLHAREANRQNFLAFDSGLLSLLLFSFSRQLMLL
ncbi:glycogen debranching enzyme N-terminal domain-containing protein [Methanosarcina acetivorans]|uniref:glycogen debranching enzyme N-terminal domain-containing protein n=1 Tax=Methanosarcina acetivorans TaxID=2214 RepID=UPI00064FDF78